MDRPLWGQSWRVGPGSFIWLPRGAPHASSVDGDETLRSLATNLPAGFEQFVAEAGEPARERTLPPPGEPDFARLDAAAAKVGIEHLAPPPDETGDAAVQPHRVATLLTGDRQRVAR